MTTRLLTTRLQSKYGVKQRGVRELGQEIILVFLKHRRDPGSLVSCLGNGVRERRTVLCSMGDRPCKDVS